MSEPKRSHSKRPKIVSYDSSLTGDETSEGETDDRGDIRKRKTVQELANAIKIRTFSRQYYFLNK